VAEELEKTKTPTLYRVHGKPEEQKLDKAARQKIESQKRVIIEGTPEWDILYRKYYNEEVKKLGI